MSLSVIGMIPPGGVWGGGAPQVSTPFLPGREKKKGKTQPKISFKSAEN